METTSGIEVVPDVVAVQNAEVNADASTNRRGKITLDGPSEVIKHTRAATFGRLDSRSFRRLGALLDTIVSRGNDVLIGLAFVACIGGLLLLKQRNEALSVAAATSAGNASREATLGTTFRRNIKLSEWAGRQLPSHLVKRLWPSDRNSLGFVAMVYTNSACERSIKDGLQSLNTFYPAIRRRSMHAIVVAALTGDGNRGNALILKQEGGLPFPFVFANRDETEASLFDTEDGTFGDEPIYFKIDSTFRIVSAFHGDQYRPELLDLWLKGSVK